MRPSRTLAIGMDVHTDAMAVADLGIIGRRQGDIDHLTRTLQAQANHLVCVSEAGPCGSWLSRSLTTKALAAGSSPPPACPTRPATG
jgi:hypothetical protein